MTEARVSLKDGDEDMILSSDCSEDRVAEVSWLYPFGVRPALPGLLMILLILFCWVWEPRASSALRGQKETLGP